ncbi:hypothetical protein CAPTEDRAFT_151173 [Capitella teleta]|uniref:Kinesin-like protein n=1 Tax=Capitella teleta TaxID=283909 RepID=R7VFI6_CAPTE|nr:hypothetical protein CAPTEDRAFT_151173 [Capitella teleta]|eukprot:ELU17379.1 hypothetical protein CAPTEDRAFT_151173 [Capitella teleta]
MASEAVKVIVRSRPMNERERDLKCKEVVTIDTKIGQCSMRNPADSKAPPKTFTFDGAYGSDSTTETIYADIGYPLVEGVTEGYNGTIFAYGQTGCGKSFSMQGITNPATQRGIIPRAFDHIFETITVSEKSKYLVHASYLEIYNEEIRDLLGKDVKQKLDLKEHPEKGVYVQNLSMHPCKHVSDCTKVMERGWKNRATGSTLMNADSSRSHSIFSIHLERCEQDEEGEDHIRAAKLNLVDLAGSERQAKTGATGDRLKEATKINLSLSALGNVISALVDGKSKHIPYRDSKLTRLLQDSLGGNTKTLMVACLSPADNNYDETLSTLRYANRAKNIKNKPKINEDPKDALLREYQAEIEKLKAMLRGEIPSDPQGTTPSGFIENAKMRIREEYEGEMMRMKQDFEDMKMSKEKLEEEMGHLQEHYQQELANVESHITSPGQVMHAGWLKELEQAMVGGEDAHNEQVKERRRKKRKYAEEHKKKLQAALAQMDGEDIMLGIYDNVQEELKVKNSMLSKEKQRSESLRQEIRDLQSEFECDRIDYLDTIRKQEKETNWLRAVVDRIHPCLRRDCNFVNLDRIKAQSDFNEETQRWDLPKMVIEKNTLPPAAGGKADVQNGAAFARPYDDFGSEDRYIQKLHQSTEQDLANNYFKSKRKEKLLDRSKTNLARGTTSPNNNYIVNGTSPISSASTWQSDTMREEQIRAAKVHGQMSGDDFGVRKPMRLESLSQSNGKPAKKNRKNKMNLETF